MRTGSIGAAYRLVYRRLVHRTRVFSCTIWFALRHFLYADFKSALVDQARGLNAYLRIEDHDPGVSLPVEIDEYSQSMPQNHLLAVFNANGQPIYQTPSGLTYDSKTAGHHTRSAGRNIHIWRSSIGPSKRRTGSYTPRHFFWSRLKKPSICSAFC